MNTLETRLANTLAEVFTALLGGTGENVAKGYLKTLKRLRKRGATDKGL